MIWVGIGWIKIDRAFATYNWDLNLFTELRYEKLSMFYLLLLPFAQFVFCRVLVILSVWRFRFRFWIWFGVTWGEYWLLVSIQWWQQWSGYIAPPVGTCNTCSYMIIWDLIEKKLKSNRFKNSFNKFSWLLSQSLLFYEQRMVNLEIHHSRPSLEFKTREKKTWNVKLA